MSDYLSIARQLAEEPLPPRFDIRNLTIALFLESYATGLLSFISRKKYKGFDPVPPVQEDVEGRIQKAFDDPVIADIAMGRVLPHIEWINEHLGIDWCMEFTALCKTAIQRRFKRHCDERRIVGGAHMLAFFAANLVRLLIVLAAFRLGAYWMLGLLALTMLLAAYVVVKGRLKLT